MMLEIRNVNLTDWAKTFILTLRAFHDDPYSLAHAFVDELFVQLVNYKSKFDSRTNQEEVKAP